MEDVRNDACGGGHAYGGDDGDGDDDEDDVVNDAVNGVENKNREKSGQNDGNGGGACRGDACEVGAGKNGRGGFDPHVDDDGRALPAGNLEKRNIASLTS